MWFCGISLLSIGTELVESVAYSLQKYKFETTSLDVGGIDRPPLCLKYLLICHSLHTNFQLWPLVSTVP